jgi:hypothetical protein
MRRINMAVMAEVTQSETGGPPIVRTFKRKAGATWKQGAVLTFVPATGLEEAASPITSGKVIGIAAHEVPLANIKADDMTTAIVIMADDDNLFTIDTESATLADTMVSQGYQLKKASNGNWMVDVVSAAASTNPAIIVLLDPRDQPPLRLGPDPTPPVRRAIVKINPVSRVMPGL